MIILTKLFTPTIYFMINLFRFQNLQNNFFNENYYFMEKNDDTKVC